MCLAIPAKILELHGDVAKVDFGDGTIRDVNVALVNPKIGEYVLVHAGFAIQIISEKDAKETLRLWDEILSLQ